MLRDFVAGHDPMFVEQKKKFLSEISNVIRSMNALHLKYNIRILVNSEKEHGMRTREYTKVIFTTTNFLSLFQIINQIQMFQTHCVQRLTNG